MSALMEHTVELCRIRRCGNPHCGRQFRPIDKGSDNPHTGFCSRRCMLSASASTDKRATVTVKPERRLDVNALARAIGLEMEPTIGGTITCPNCHRKWQGDTDTCFRCHWKRI